MHQAKLRHGTQCVGTSIQRKTWSLDTGSSENNDDKPEINFNVPINAHLIESSMVSVINVTPYKVGNP